MKLEAFETLDAVLRSGSLAAAAKICHLTPSAVSLQMKQIEAYLGQQLFDRSGLGVKPLPCAFEVVDAMQQALSRLGELRRHVAAAVEGTIRLGIIESMQPLLLPGLTRGVRARYPKLVVQSRRGKSAALTDAVKAGDLDAAVVAQPETGGSSRLEWMPLMRQELAIIAPPTEIEATPTTLFKRHEWICYDRKTIAGRLAARYARRRFGVQHPDIELDAVRAILAMVNGGLGVSIVQLSEPGILLAFPVRVVPLADMPVIRFALVVRRSDSDSRLIGILQELLRNCLPGDAA